MTSRPLKSSLSIQNKFTALWNLIYAFFCLSKIQNSILHMHGVVYTAFYLIHCYCWVQHFFSLSISFLVGSSTQNLGRKSRSSVQPLVENPAFKKKASASSFGIVHLTFGLLDRSGVRRLITCSKATPCCSAKVFKRTISDTMIFFMASAHGLLLSLLPGLPFDF